MPCMLCLPSRRCLKLARCTEPSASLAVPDFIGSSPASANGERAGPTPSLPPAAADRQAHAAPPGTGRVPPAAAGASQPAESATQPAAAGEADRTAAAAKAAVLDEPAGAMAPQPGLPEDTAEPEQEHPSATAAGEAARDADTALTDGQQTDGQQMDSGSADGRSAAGTAAGAATAGVATAAAAASFAAGKAAEKTPTANGGLDEPASLPAPLPADVPAADSPLVSIACSNWSRVSRAAANHVDVS